MEQLLATIETIQYELPEILFVLLVIVPAFIWIAVALWVWKDISSRTGNIIAIILCFLLVLLLPLLGLIIYLLIRPEHTKIEESSMQLFHASVLDRDITSCPNCKNLVRKDYKFCPHCSASLEKKCPNCNAEVNPIWNHCVACGHDLIHPTRWERLSKRIKQSDFRANGIRALLITASFIFNLPQFFVNILKAGWHGYVGWVSSRVSSFTTWRQEKRKQDKKTKKSAKKSKKKKR